MQGVIIELLIAKVALPIFQTVLKYSLKKLSKMKNGLTKDITIGILSPIVESVDNPIDGEDIIQLVKKLKG